MGAPETTMKSCVRINGLEEVCLLGALVDFIGEKEVDAEPQRFGVYQIGDVYERSCCDVGAPSGSSMP